MMQNTEITPEQWYKMWREDAKLDALPREDEEGQMLVFRDMWIKDHQDG